MRRLLVGCAGTCTAVVVRDQTLEEFTDGVERRGFRLGARVLRWCRLRSHSLRVSGLRAARLRGRGGLHSAG
jgi:hypothetical protein